MLVQGWSGRYREPVRRGLRDGEGWYEHLRGWRLVAQRGMRAHRVVVPSPALDDDLRLAQRVEDLAIEQLVAQPGIERLHVPVLPRRAGFDIGGLGAEGRDPGPHRPGHELWSGVGADVPRYPAQDEQVREHVDNVGSLELARHPDGEALVGEFVDDVEHAIFPAIVGAVLDKVVGPHVS